MIRNKKVKKKKNLKKFIHLFYYLNINFKGHLETNECCPELRVPSFATVLNLSVLYIFFHKIEYEFFLLRYLFLVTEFKAFIPETNR